MWFIPPLALGLNKANAETGQKNPNKENKAFKTDSVRRETVGQPSVLFKMAAPSTSSTPSPTAAAASVEMTP